MRQCFKSRIQSNQKKMENKVLITRRGILCLDIMNNMILIWIHIWKSKENLWCNMTNLNSQTWVKDQMKIAMMKYREWIQSICLMMSKVKKQRRMQTKRSQRKSLTRWLPIWPRFLVKTGEGRSNQQFVKLTVPESRQWETKLVKQKSKKLEKIKFNISSRLQKL